MRKTGAFEIEKIDGSHTRMRVKPAADGTKVKAGNLSPRLLARVCPIANLPLLVRRDFLDGGLEIDDDRNLFFRTFLFPGGSRQTMRSGKAEII